MSRIRVIAAAAAGCLLLAGCGSSHTTTTTVTVTRTVTHTVTTTSTSQQGALCTSSDLGATFAVQNGSAGAGHIVYTLILTNTSASACTMSGFPTLRLFDRKGGELATHAAPEPGAGAPSALLQPDGSISFSARFSPDIPGTGEPQTGPCEPTAGTVRVTPPGGGTLDAAVSPPTAVCEHGAIDLRAA